MYVIKLVYYLQPVVILHDTYQLITLFSLQHTAFNWPKL